MRNLSHFVNPLRGQIGDKPEGLFGSLLRDRSANVLVITAAAVLPMIALTGSAIDISRVYLAKSRLQAACDSGVLAGRKAMTTLVYTQAAQTRAQAMFDFNFEETDYGSDNTNFAAVADAEGKLTGTATTTLPMIVMNMMGVGDSDIDVTCSADIQVPNIDIVFVLDVTGSMDESISGTKKIDSLKAATIGFYDSIATAMAGNTRTRVRYGFVPYSQIVNGSDLFKSSPNFDTLGQLPLSHVIDTQTVQSRVANFNTPVMTPWAADTSVTPVTFDQRFNSGTQISKEPNVVATPTGTVISNADCEFYSSNKSFEVGNSTAYRAFFFPRTTYPGDQGIGESALYKLTENSPWTTTEPTTGNSYIKATFSRVSATWSDNSGATTTAYKACTRRVTHTKYVRATNYAFTDWTYRPVDYNVANFSAGQPLTYVSAINKDTALVPTAGTYSVTQLAGMANQTGFTKSTTNWNGCLEERETTPATAFSPIPLDALDMNYLSGGTSRLSRWRPMNPDLTWMRPGTANQTTTATNGKPGVACPTASMRNLREYGTRSDFTTYVNSLKAAGNTYLDVGMIWGLRFIVPQGLFAQRNLTGPNGGQISRHLIFLTDGEPVSSADTYSAYGIEQMEKRITGTNGVAAATLHARRFQAMCDAERGRVGIWAVAFGTSVTGNLTNCADSGRAMQANNTTELRNAFSRIANEVADLRLVE